MAMRHHHEVERGQVDTLGLHVVRKDLGVVARVEQDALAAVLDEGREAPVLLHRRGFAERIVEDGDLGLVRLGERRCCACHGPAATKQCGSQELESVPDVHDALPWPGSFAQHRAHAFSSRLSSLRKRQSVPSARSLLGLDLIMPGLVQAQRVEAHGVLGVELAPLGVRNLGQRLERVLVALVNPPSTSCCATRSGSAAQIVGGLEHGAQEALGGNRMIADEVPVARTACSRNTATMACPWRC